MADFVKPTPLTDLFGSSIQLIIPRFQRKFEWSCANDDSEIQTLWDDILQACDENSDHFIGSVVIMPYSEGTGLHKYYLIDGQQRCTTISILFRALYEYLEEYNNINYRSLCKKLIMEEDYNAKKLVRSVDGGDYEMLMDYINNPDRYPGKKTCVEKCYQFFIASLQEEYDHGGIERIIDIYETVRNKIKVVLITVGDEDPCVVFESLNNTGRKLTPISMVRNYVMLKCSSIDIRNEQFQDDIYDTYWKPFESLADESKLGEYLRVYLMMDGTRVSKSEIYKGVKTRIDREIDGVENTKEMREAVNRLFFPWIDHYNLYLITTGQKQFEGNRKVDQKIRTCLSTINECGLKSQRNYILKMLIEYNKKHLEVESLYKNLKIVESYLMRRVVMQDLTNNTVDRLFLELCKDDVYSPETLFNRISRIEDAGFWPTDEDLRQSLKSKDFYSERRNTVCISILNRMDMSCGNNLESIDSVPSVEHIFPQTPTTWWNKYCNEDYQFMCEHKHRIGNVTLFHKISNSETSNKPYDEKKKSYSGSRYLITNEIPDRYEIWNKDSFEDREKRMIELLLNTWPRDFDKLVG